ncbi:PepSY domain-containing protein [Streptomyces cavernae]|uniref:PepSY domain-containing protein n=1 Tax=Streptomyces cavernae TaxID=2259034 RepID=UPI000FEBC45D|nr:PepSY domain-containing protein [Streptomyces cavernae]
MKRKLVIATVAAAALVGGGTATALAVSGDDATAQRSSVRLGDDAGRVGADRDDDQDDDRDDAVRDQDDRSDAAERATGQSKDRITAEAAIAAALNHTPRGTVVSADLDDEAGKVIWDVDMLTRDNTWKSIQVEPATGRILGAHTEQEDDTAQVRNALKGASVSAKDAARAAAANGTVTSVGLDDEDGTWEAETAAAQGKEKDWTVDPKTGKVTADRSEDGRSGDDRSGDDQDNDRSDDADASDDD